MIYFPFHILKWEFSHFWVYCHHISHLCYWILIWGSAEEKHGTVKGKNMSFPFISVSSCEVIKMHILLSGRKKSSGMDNKLNVVWNTVFQQGQNWGDYVFFGKVIHFLVEFSFFFLCLVVCQVLWVQWCSLGWQQRRSTLSCSMFSSWYALPTPLLPSYWQREELSPGRRPQNHDQCCKQSFHCFYLCLKYSL